VGQYSICSALHCKVLTTTTIPVMCTQDAVRINGPTESTQRLPNTLSISIPGVYASKLLQELREQLAASTAAACHSGAEACVSSVLAAMHVRRIGGHGGEGGLSVEVQQPMPEPLHQVPLFAARNAISSHPLHHVLSEIAPH
jgi:hypothetical protein